MGIDIHKSSWTITAICEGEIVHDETTPADLERFDNILSRFIQGKVHTVYEAGCFGYRLHDSLIARGYDSVVTPPSLVPRIGGSVKTDRRDSKKLAGMLVNGFLKRVYVLRPEEKADRELVRTRNQIERHRKRVQSQIKAKLLLYGMEKPKWLKDKKWTHKYLNWLEGIVWEYESMRIVMSYMIDLFRHLNQQYRELTQTEKFRESLAALIWAFQAGGGPMSIKATPLMTFTEALDVFKKAGSLGYRPPTG